MTTRWFVEVSPIDAETLKERYCVEALQWQQALQQARKLRGDRGPLSKFSIELVDTGYRATDPSVRIRYVVSKAPGDTPLSGAKGLNGSHRPATPPLPTVTAAPATTTPLASPAPPSAPPPAPPVVEAAAAPDPAPAPGGPAFPAPEPPPGRGRSARATSPAVPRPKQGPSSGPAAPPGAAAREAPPAPVAVAPAPPSPVAPAPAAIPIAAAPPPAVTAPAPAAPPAPAVVAPPAATAPMPVVAAPVPAAVAPAAAVPAAPPAEEAVPSLPGMTLISRRSEEPREGAPIAYREYAFAVTPGLSPRELERYARATWEQVRTALAARPEGKFVQIAFFDHEFQGRPERPPLAVVAWKDWRGEPVLKLHGVAPAAAPAPPAPPPEPVAAVAPPPEPAPVPVVAAPAPPGPVPLTAAAVLAAEPVPLSAAAAAAFAREPAAPDGAPRGAPPPPSSRFPAPSSDRRSARPLASVETAHGRRGPSEDLISELFEDMHQLRFMPDIVTGAEYVLNVLGRVIPCEGVLVHVFDINRRQFVVVRASGPNGTGALLHRTPDTFALFRETFRRARTLSFPSTGTEEGFQNGRWEQLGVKPAAALCGAVQQGGRYLGVIELANPAGGEAFQDAEINAVDYICEQFADFVASRPIVLDDDAVLPKA